MLLPMNNSQFKSSHQRGYEKIKMKGKRFEKLHDAWVNDPLNPLLNHVAPINQQQSSFNSWSSQPSILNMRTAVRIRRERESKIGWYALGKNLG